MALIHFNPYCNTAIGCSQMEQICIVAGNTMAANVSLGDESRGCTAAVKRVAPATNSLLLWKAKRSSSHYCLFSFWSVPVIS